MAMFHLVPHPSSNPPAGRAVAVRVARQGDGLTLDYLVGGPATLIVPPVDVPARTDGLWRTTCLELFAGLAGGAYLEFNFSPSTRWAAYRFTGYRDGMTPLPLAAPPRVLRGESGALSLAVSLPLALENGAAIGLTAVIEEADGTKSYWALAHAPGPPDFHNRDCFIATLPAPERS
ncbi:DOMON-like domain-containing protein [Sphingomonas sp.]|uniref:DOMON-like domain-containing protein n=1 Tax=Sphingomonas sp. TaxID=28214 RepID=UPI001E14DFA1|nr:DOMON-like domain-containing protein [Sphingomonas sp.]MBX9796125.1 DOMON-like domain-containing protein [Sphingomonas sp.]